MIELKGKKVLVLGLGLHGGGVATALWLYKQGAKLIVSDLRSKEVLRPSLAKLKNYKIEFTLGEHRQQDVAWADVVVQNPGVPKESVFIKSAKKLGKTVVNEAALFFDRCAGTVIGVTGTRGKSSTAALLAALLRAKFPDVILAGNIGSAAMLAIVDKIKPGQIVVLELSSWQLEGLAAGKTAPHVSVVTNLYPDHLNRYKSLADYYKSKEEIFRYQTAADYLILNADQAQLREWEKPALSHVMFFGTQEHGRYGIYLKHGRVFWRQHKEDQEIIKISDINLAGRHNLTNALAAITVARLFNVSLADMKKVLASPPVLSGRQELVREMKGLKFINDTTATTPEATLAALERFGAGKKNIILIAGGADKNLDYEAWARGVKKHCAAAFLLAGPASDKMAKALVGFKNLRSGYASLTGAVKDALKSAAGGNIILFSPGAASFNMWNHEFARGDEFVKIVNKL